MGPNTRSDRSPAPPRPAGTSKDDEHDGGVSAHNRLAIPTTYSVPTTSVPEVEYHLPDYSGLPVRHLFLLRPPQLREQVLVTEGGV